MSDACRSREPAAGAFGRCRTSLKGENRGTVTPGDRFGACAIDLHMPTTWFKPPEALCARFPNIARAAAAVEARPASARAIGQHRS